MNGPKRYYEFPWEQVKDWYRERAWPGWAIFGIVCLLITLFVL